MRVLLLNYEYPPLGGGAGVATAALAQGLAVRGVAVDVVTARDDRSDPPETEFAGLKLHPVFTKRKGVHQAGIAGAYSYLLGAVPIVRRLLHSNRYDAVHVFFSLPTGALIPLVGLTAEPVVVSLRGSDVPGYDRSKPKLQRAHRALLPLTRWIWRRADRVVAVCDSLRKLARETEPDLRVDVVPNGVDLDLFRPAPEPRPARRGPVRCIAVARLIQRKGLADLLRACSLLERGRRICCAPWRGSWGWAATCTLRERSSERHWPSATERRISSHWCRSTKPSAPSSPRRSRATLPIVGSDIGGIPELVTEGENGFLVPAGEPEPLARAVRRLAGDAEMRLRMGARNQARAETTLSWDAMTDRYLGLYHELAGTPASRPSELVGASG